MGFKLTILGSNSAVPAFDRHPSAQVLQFNERLFLIDCGEGTQMQITRYGIKPHRISHIFISHLHGDHYFGLVGLISTMHLLGRTIPLQIFGPAALNEIIKLQLQASLTTLRFPLHFIPVEPGPGHIILEEEGLTVSSILLNHHIPCTGFLFKSTTKSYAYCTDTAYEVSLEAAIQNVDVLYHEATFMEDLAGRAKETFHSTAMEAGTVALKAGVGKLLIGHFSSRYKSPDPLLMEAKSVFPATELALEGSVFEI
jgi:ribonuclease Z